MELQVKCIVREKSDDPNSAIIEIGGFNWQYSLDEAFAHIKNKKYRFYVKDNENNVAYVKIVKQKDGSKHLRTTPDESMINNLESLRSCEDYRLEQVSSHISKQLK